MMENLEITKSKVKECISGMMVENTKANGRIIKWKDVDCSNGLMAADSKESISMIKSMDSVFSAGQTVKSTLAFGIKANSTDME